MTAPYHEMLVHPLISLFWTVSLYSAAALGDMGRFVRCSRLSGSCKSVQNLSFLIVLLDITVQTTSRWIVWIVGKCVEMKWLV